MFSSFKPGMTDSEYASKLLTGITDTDRIKSATLLSNLARHLIVGSHKVTRLVEPPDRYMCFVSDGELDRSKDVQTVEHKIRPAQGLLITTNTNGEYVQALFYNRERFNDVGEIPFEELGASIDKIGRGQKVDVMELWFIASAIYRIMKHRRFPAASVVVNSEFSVNALSRTPTGVLVYTRLGVVEYRIEN